MLLCTATKFLLSDSRFGGCLICDMTPRTDAELLRAYTRDAAEPAFGELITRHTGLVYSAALRQCACPELAREVTQDVFTDLARKARTLAETISDDATLGPWLYKSTRYAALNAARHERRRVAREHTLMPELHATPDEPAWDRVAPVLDDAMAELNDAEREAVVLRYFQNLDFHAVGRALNVSDDTAQKRVSRAVERLRELIAKRGVSVGGSGLVILISTNAVLVAPIGLSAAIVAATVTSVATTATLLTMTTMQKAVIASVLAAAVTVGIYEANEAATARADVRAGAEQNATLSNQLAGLARERDQLAGQLAATRAALAGAERAPAELLRLRDEVTRLRQATAGAGTTSNSIASRALEWAGNAEKLKARFEEQPEMKIPELQFLRDQDWLYRAQFSLDRMETWTDYQWRNNLMNLRESAKALTAQHLGTALNNFLLAHDGLLPGDLHQLIPYYAPYDGFPQNLDPAILSRYRLLASGSLRDLPFESVLIEEVAAPADADFDTHFQITATGYAYRGVGKHKGTGRGALHQAAAMQQFRKTAP